MNASGAHHDSLESSCIGCVEIHHSATAAGAALSVNEPLLIVAERSHPTAHWKRVRPPR
jgi:hypothetical protein